MRPAPRFTLTPMATVPAGWYNGAALERPDGGYLFVVRSQDDRLHGATLDDRFEVTAGFRDLGTSMNIDPRLVRWDEQPYLLSCYTGAPNGERLELWPLTEGASIHRRDAKWKHSRFDVVHGWPGYVKGSEKNWAPFVASDGELHLVYSMHPHRVLWYDRQSRAVHRVVEGVDSRARWEINGLGEFRLSAPPVRLSDGTFLSTMHAKSGSGYFGGFYQFEGEKPYRILRASMRPAILPGHAVGPHLVAWRPEVIFVMSMHVEEQTDKLTLVGGSRDSCQVILRFSFSEVMASLEDVTI